MFGKWRWLIAGLITVLLVGGCAGNYVKIAPRASETYENLGPVEGSGCGTMLFLSTAYNFIPVNLNERVDDAYKEALGKVPGATGLINVSYSETWFWWVLGTTRCTKITGEAVRWAIP